jgi:hypothetical protein
MRALRLFAAILVLLLPSPSSAQDFSVLTGLFQHFKGVSLFGQVAARKHSPTFYGGGTEVEIDLAPSTAHTPVMLGLAASYMQGIAVRRNDVNLQASIRSLPTIAAYVGRSSNRHVEPFLRLSVGLSELWNAQAVGADGNRSTVNAQTVDYGAMGGVELKHFAIRGFFLEAGYVARRFPAIDWGKTNGTAQKNWPRHLDASRWQMAFGFRFHVPDEPSKTPPPAPPPVLVGNWRLTAVDDLKVPTVVEVARVPVGSTSPDVTMRKDEIVDGTLVVGAASYTLTLYHRETLLDSGGKLVNMGPLSSSTETGTVTPPRWGAPVVLHPTTPGGGTSYELTRDGDAIMLRQPGTNHLLTFAKAK